MDASSAQVVSGVEADNTHMVSESNASPDGAGWYPVGGNVRLQAY
jgi:hypothetical protein